MIQNAFRLLSCLLITACATRSSGDYQARFDVSKSDLSSMGRNPYFVLLPGYELILEGREHLKPITLTITVTRETKVVDGVTTRVVVERETSNGVPIEVSRNYFAISQSTGDVFYFGEDVDVYRNGRVTSHEGSWLSGVNGARFGLFLPGRPVVGARFQTEIAPTVAMDRTRIVSLTGTLGTPEGEFKNCLVTEETSGIESGTERKVYAQRIGLVQDGGLKLMRYGVAQFR